MFRYVHTNIFAQNAGKLIEFYKTVLHCKSINETRNLSGAWLDELTSLTMPIFVANTYFYPDIKEIIQSLKYSHTMR